MKLQEKIDEIRPYFKSLENYNEALIVRVQFPKKWAVFPKDDNTIKPAVSDKVPHEYWYYGSSDKISVEDIFDFIKETIEVNQSLEQKAKLLVEKAKELQELFETTPLAQLQTLRFVTEQPKTDKPKRKYTRRKKVAENEKEQPKIDSKETIIDSGETKSEENKVVVSSSVLNKLKLAKKEKAANE